MKKTIILLLFGFQVSAQVSTLPNAIGIGNNTDPNVPFHINKSISEQIRLQGTTPFISFYEGATAKAYLQGFSGGIVLGSYGSSDVHLYTGFTPRLTVLGTNGFVGINKSNPSQPLDVTGNVQFSGALRPNGQAGGVGQFLMSTGAFAPQWTTISENPQIGFQATFPSSFSIPHGTNPLLAGFTEDYDDGNNFADFAGEFTVPSVGLYRFEYKMIIDRIPPNPIINNGKLIIRLMVNGSVKCQTEFEYEDSGTNSITKHGFESIKLNQNDIVRFQVFQVNEHGNTVRIHANGGSNDPLFIGYKIY